MYNRSYNTNNITILNLTRISFTNPAIVNGLTWPLIVRAFVTPIGVLTNFINICVFLNPRLNDRRYRYMLASSVTNVLYLSLAFSTIFTTDDFKSSLKYSDVVYSIVFDYTSASLAIFRIFIEVVLSFQTFCKLTNRTYLEKIPYKLILLILFITSLFFYGQIPFAYNIKSEWHNSGYLEYQKEENLFSKSTLGTSITIIQTTIRLFLAVFVLTVLNVINLIEFKKRFKILEIEMTTINPSK